MPKDKGPRTFDVITPTPVELLLPNGTWIEGSVYLSAEQKRFSDAWEQVVRDARSFVAIADAETRAPDGSLAEIDPFLLVRKDSIVAIRPLKED
jgi:hypothetical protein